MKGKYLSNPLVSLLTDKVVLSVLVLTYLSVFSYSFSLFVVPKFGYFGFVMHETMLIDKIFIYLTVFFISLFLPIYIKRASEILLMFLYVFIYIPSCVVLFSIREDWLPYNDAFEMWGWVSCCFIVILSFTKLPIFQIKSLKINKFYFVTTNLIIVFVLCLLFFKTKGNFSIVSHDNLSELNDVRNSAGLSGVFSYIYLWIITFSIGLLFSIYDNVDLKIRFILLSFIYCFFAFSMGAKILLVAPLVFLGVYFWLFRYKAKFLYIFWGLIIVLILFQLITLIFPKLGFTLSALLLFRTLSISSLSFAVYFDYFQVHDYTNFQHIGIVAQLFNTNFGSPLPVKLAEYYGLGNFNANFIVNDGYAGMGYRGMLIMSFVYSSFIYLLDCVTKRIKFSIVVFGLTYFGMYLGNVSLFTLLLSHGLLILFFYFLIFSRFLLK